MGLHQVATWNGQGVEGWDELEWLRVLGGQEMTGISLGTEAQGRDMIGIRGNGDRSIGEQLAGSGSEDAEGLRKGRPEVAGAPGAVRTRRAGVAGRHAWVTRVAPACTQQRAAEPSARGRPHL